MWDTTNKLDFIVSAILISQTFISCKAISDKGLSRFSGKFLIQVFNFNCFFLGWWAPQAEERGWILDHGEHPAEEQEEWSDQEADWEGAFIQISFYASCYTCIYIDFIQFYFLDLRIRFRTVKHWFIFLTSNLHNLNNAKIIFNKSGCH